MFKYPSSPRKSDPAPVNPAPAPASSPFGGSGVPDDWAPLTPAAPGIDPSMGAPAAAPSPFDGGSSVAPAVSSRNVLNSDVTVVGILRFTDDLLVDGSVEGEITSDGVLTVGANATIAAGEGNKVAVHTKSAIIHGRVTGDVVVSDRVELASTAELVGDVTASKISIQEGAVFIGYCRVGVAANAPVPAPVSPAIKKSTSKGETPNLLD